MIKALILDFDGTLCQLVEVHYTALNNAIKHIAGDEFIITRDEHIRMYNGLSTKTKLHLLITNKNLPSHLIDPINQAKQQFTLDSINSLITENLQLKLDIEKLKSEGYLIYCASNALLKTVELGLKKMGIFELFDCIIGNDNIKNQKPYPEIYLHAFIKAGLDPKECLIIEDSKNGRFAAARSGAHVCTVDNEKDTTYEHIKKSILLANNKRYTIPWIDSKLNVLVPMAGRGQRFRDKGYQLPKPLIDVNGKPMIQWVIDNLNIDGNYIFVVQKEHYEQFNLGIILPLMAPGCKIVQTDGMTEGAACTTLLAKEFINNNDHLLIANSDQFVEWNSNDFLYDMLSSEVDGGILTFRDNNPKWSFAKLDELGYVTEVAEKKPISDLATVGIYWFNRGREYVQYAEEMIKKDIRVGKEFYVCPVYNEYIAAGKKIKTQDCHKMWGLGTPEDYEHFLKTYQG